jgi:predicted Ser/Thr protein kinase
METQNEEVQISTYKFNKSDVLGKGSTGTVYLGKSKFTQAMI